MKFFKIAVLLVTIIFVGCKKMPGISKDGGKINITMNYKEGEPLAKVGNVTLTVEALNEDFLDRQGTFKGAAHLNTENKKNEYVENQVMQETMFQEAIKLGYFDKPEVVRDIKKIIVQRLMKDKLNDETDQKPATEEEMKEHYEKNQNLYNRKEAQKVSFLEIPIGNEAGKIKTIAENIHKEALKTIKHADASTLSQIAMRHIKNSQGFTQIQVQMTGFLEKEQFEGKFGQGSFEKIKQLESTGQFAPLLKTDKAYFVVMKTGARKELKETFEEAKPKIEKRLAFENRGKHYEEYIKNLKEKYNVKVYKEKIANLGKIDKKEETNLAHEEPKPEE